MRWLIADGDSFARWVAQARAFQDGIGSDAPNASAGFGGVRLTFQTPAADGAAIDTLTRRGGRVGAGTTTPVGALDVASTTQGFLPPRMTTAQRDLIGEPSEGSLIYNVTTKRIDVHDGTAWRELGADSAG